MAFLDVIIPTYSRIEPLRCMLASLMAQTDGDWTANVIIDNEMGNTTSIMHDLLMFHIEYNKRIQISFSGKRYNDFGHTPREIGKQQSTADYCLLTGDDNYYTPNFVEELKKAAVNKPGMIYWDMVHSHYNYQFFECHPHTHQIDMGAFATRNDLAKQIKLGTRMQADGDFVEEFNVKFPFEKKVKINKILFVHN